MCRNEVFNTIVVYFMYLVSSNSLDHATYFWPMALPTKIMRNADKIGHYISAQDSTNNLAIRTSSITSSRVY